jgi:Domain of unknown function (DUF4189)
MKAWVENAMTMPTARSIARPIAVALAIIVIAEMFAGDAFAADPRSIVVAQSTLGGPEQLPPLVAPTPPNYAPPSNSSPRTDYIPPGLRPNQPPPGIELPNNSPRTDFTPPDRRPGRPPSPQTDFVPPGLGPNQQPSTNSGDMYWGAIAFTADGSYSSAWKASSQPEAEARVLKQCASYGRGSCEVTSFSGQECVGLATFIGNYRRRRWLLSFTAGGMTYPDAQRAALDRCNSDERSQGHCQTRTTACADGR